MFSRFTGLLFVCDMFFECNYENNQQGVLYRLIYYSNAAVYVSGDVFAHHQEHLTVFAVSGSFHSSCCRLVSRRDTSRKHRPKHVELPRNNKLIYIAHLVGYFHGYVRTHVAPKK
jgi:hypothetical protein